MEVTKHIVCIRRTKEKTRVLAHSRRQKENDTFTDIAEALPLQGGAKDLDKASLLRVAIHYLKLRRVLHDGENFQDGEGTSQLRSADQINFVVRAILIA